jgi:hypothetical protein
MINPNSWYIAMHLDRLNEELLSDTYGKQEEEFLKKKRKTKSPIKINSSDDDQKKDDL